MDGQTHAVNRRIPQIAGALLVVLIGYTGWHSIKIRDTSLSRTPGRIQRVTIVQPVLAPPPVPIKAPQPRKDVAATPPPEPAAESSDTDEHFERELGGLDGAGAGGFDSFGLTARDSGTRVTVGSSVLTYKSMLQRSVEQTLMRDEALRLSHYRVVLGIEIDTSGGIIGAVILAGSGDAAIDRRILRVIARGIHLETFPPSRVPHYLKLEIASRS